MPTERPNPPSTLALSTKVEEDFVAPLTSLRGALEILRDVPDLSRDERDRFLKAALSGCARLERSVEDLSRTVYAAGQQADASRPAGSSLDSYRAYAGRVRVLEEMDTVELDFSHFAFSNSDVVNEFYDFIERIVDETGRDWYFVINYTECSIWPEAWVAFAHRAKRINVTHSLGTVRYAIYDDAEANDQTDVRSGGYDPNLFETREAALARIDAMKLARTS